MMGVAALAGSLVKLRPRGDGHGNHMDDGVKLLPFRHPSSAQDLGQPLIGRKLARL
jgi:hypothetical protein